MNRQKKVKISPKSEIAAWDQWDSKKYLKDYYGYVEPDEVETIKFLAQTFKTIEGLPIMLEFGCGPTLHHIFPAVPYVSEIHMTDYLNSNLEEVRNWIQESEEKHNWKPFVSFTLQQEGMINPTMEQIMERKKITRRKINLKRLIKSDAGDINPLGPKYRGYYPVVMTCYCADGATADKQTWERYMRNIASTVAPGGSFIVAAVRKCKSYRTEDMYFPSPNIDEEDMLRVLKLDFPPDSITIEVRIVPEHEVKGYQGVIFAHAVKAK